jgi:tetratricopeptide (TPR) repeat protein
MATGKSGDAKRTSTVPKDAIPRQRVNIQRMQNVLLIWLDSNIDDNKEDCRNTVTELRRVVNDVNTYTDGDQCIQFINTINNNKVCMIISGSLGQLIVPRVHNMSQVDSIFIFCGNKTHHEQWAKEWRKVKGVFTKISPICEALKQAAQQCEHNAISMSFVASNTGDASNQTLDRLDPSFMYTQILKEILLTIKFEQKHIQEYIDYCREQFADNNQELSNIRKLETKYRTETPIWWYTCQCFLYPMLNLGLRLMDVDIIIRMGFFIGDLYRHIEKLHSDQFGGHHTGAKFTVYRGQGLSEEDFKQLKNTKSGLISFNNFLSTSKTRHISLGFADEAAKNPDLVGILFILKIDPTQSTTPFASIRGVSFFPKEDEVMFAMHTVFRINDIKSIDGNNRLFEVNLTLTGDNDQDLRVLTDRIREESFPHAEGWYRLGSVLLKMDQYDKAKEVYEVLLEQTTNESEKAHIYGQLGWVKANQGEYQEAITFYEKALAIQQQSLPPNHPDLGFSYNNIGEVYRKMGDDSKALSSYEKALAIKQQSLPLNHPSLAMSYGNIGIVYCNMGDYPKALSSYEKVFAIQQQSLPPNHPDLGASYNNIGVVHDKMGNYSKSRSCFERAVDIGQQSLPTNHPALQGYRKNLELAKKKS